MRQKVVELRPYLVDHALTIDDLPDWVKLQFKEGGDHALPPREGSGVDYAFGNIVNDPSPRYHYLPQSVEARFVTIIATGIAQGEVLNVGEIDIF